MCRPSPHTLKESQANATRKKLSSRIRRSRKWKENSCQDNKLQNETSPIKKTNQNRSKRRTTSKPQLNSKFDDSSTASTASLPSDDSLSNDIFTPEHPKKTQSGGPKTRNKKQGKKKSKTKKLSIVEISDISEEEKEDYVALDAEMVGVGRDGIRSALARVSIVNWEGEVLFDKHVKVNEPVTDYRTFVSGITESDLESKDAIPYIECQLMVKRIIQDKIVVGHGLKNDFRVLDLTHPWYAVRDTAKYEPFMKPDIYDPSTLVPKKLKVLAKDKLGLVIQEEGRAHSPIEDAVAAMELFKKHRVKWEKAMAWKLNKTKQITGQ